MGNSLKNTNAFPLLGKSFKKEEKTKTISGEEYLHKILNVTFASPHGLAVAVEACEVAGCEVRPENGLYSRGASVAGYFNPKDNVVLINTASNPFWLIGAVAHELRHASQHYHLGRVDSDIKFDTKSFIMLNRAKEADAVANQLFTVLELKQKGINDPFNTFAESLPDIAEKGLEAYNKHGGRPEKVLPVIFEAWYESPSLRKFYEEQHTSYLRDADWNATKEDKILSQSISAEEIATKICRNPDGSCYLPDFKILETTKYLGVSQETKDEIKKRTLNPLIKADKTIQKIPVYSVEDKKVTPKKRTVINKAKSNVR